MISSNLHSAPLRPPTIWARYGIALAAVLAAEILREGIFFFPVLAQLGQRSPLSFLYPAVMVAALYGGRGPGFLAICLSFCVALVRLKWGPIPPLIPAAGLGPRLLLFLIVDGLILMVCDRIHRARAELARAMMVRADAEGRIARMLEHISDAFFTVDRDFRFTFVNRQCEAYYGKPREEMLGRVFFEVFPGHRGGPVEQGAIKAMNEQVPVHAEFYSMVAQRWVEGDVYPTPDGLSAYFRDVTERHAAVDALRQSEERYRRLVETAQEGICQIDAAGRITYANPALARMLGESTEAVVGRSLADFVEGDFATPPERSAALLQELRLRRADGSSFLARFSTSPMMREGGGESYTGELAVISDITERRAIEIEREELLRREQRARAEAEAANRRKDQFLAILSHELRTPLTPVIARLELLRRDASLGAVAKNGLEMIRRNVEMEARLIDDLLDITRLSRGQLKLQLELVDAHQTLRDALEIYHFDITRKHQRVTLDLSAGEHTVRADAVRLQQVFWNLIGNAAKYTPENGEIVIRSMNPSRGGENGNGTAQPRLHVEIVDNGIGIAPEVMSRIFDPFEQGEQTLTRRYGGLGLGLSISRTLLQMHGGTLTAQSAGPGKGSTFTLELPTVAALAAPRGPKQVASPARATAQRILLVDDNDDTLRVMARLLRLNGHQVVTADSVSTALHAAAQPFDLLISDIGLPDGTGWDLMKQLRERGPVRGIAVSGFSMDEDMHRSEEVGFLEHLSKPINPDDLEQAIRRAVVG